MSSRRTIVFLSALVVLAGACRPSVSATAPPAAGAKPTQTADARPQPPAPAPAPRAAEAACRIEWSDELDAPAIEGVALGEWALDEGEQLEWSVYADSPDSILAAVVVPYEYMGAPLELSNTLWRVKCADPTSASVVLRRQHADFGHAALAPDGQHLFFGDGGVVTALHLATGGLTSTLAGEPIEEPDCWAGETTTSDVVLGVDEAGNVRIDRGANCGFEADWEGTAYVIRDPLGTPTLYRESPITTVAADAAGVLWVGNAGTVAVAEDLQTYGGVWRSPDGDAKWKLVRIPGMSCPAQAIWADRTEAGRVLVAEADCSYGPAEACDEGCGLFATSDGGKTWSHVGLDEDDFAGGSYDAEPGDVRKIRYVDMDTLWSSHDGGTTWQLVAEGEELPESEPARAPNEARAHGSVFRGTRDGLERERNGRRDIVFRTAEH